MHPMDFYMKYGVYSYRHEEQPIGLPLAYKIKNGKVKGQFAADLSFEIKATREEIQDFINKVVEDKEKDKTLNSSPVLFFL